MTIEKSRKLATNLPYFKSDKFKFISQVGSLQKMRILFSILQKYPIPTITKAS